MSSICICFPLSEPPRSFYPEEQKIASRVKCPIHGERFQRRERLLRFHSMWLLERRFQSYLRRTEQYRRAWAVSFPDWPTKDEDDENVYLLFKDGSKYIAWREAAPSDSIHWRSHQVKGPDERPIGTDANKKQVPRYDKKRQSLPGGSHRGRPVLLPCESEKSIRTWPNRRAQEPAPQRRDGSVAPSRERHGYPNNAPADHFGNLFRPTSFKDRRDFGPPAQWPAARNRVR